MKKLFFYILSALVFSSAAFAQTGTLKGVVKDASGKLIEGVSITTEKNGTSSDANGVYSLKITAGKFVTVTFSHISYKTYTKRIRVQRNRTVTFSPKLLVKTEEIDEVIVKDNRDKVKGIDKVDVKTVKNLPSANAGIESTLKNIGLGVSGNNELSTQYNVRGGNYDENLVYVNGIEVYRPFLVRSGQQEGLSFVNPNMTQNVRFSAGGFQAKYGDKLSSVLDITYRKPKEFGVSVDASLLGASATVEGQLLDNKLSAILGVRYRNNSLFVNSRDTETNFKPTFTDVQTYISHQIDNKFSMDYMVSFSLNTYNYKPLTRRTNFGTVTDAKALVVRYRGNEKDRYQTFFGAMRGSYKPTKNLKIDLIASKYNTQEEEYYDILGQYAIGEVNANFGSDNFGDIELVQSIGSQLDHARNDLDALIGNIQLKATLKKNNHVFEAGVKYQAEEIKDRIIEWQVIDSAGFSVRPPSLLPRNDEPYEPFTGPIIPFTSIRAFNKVRTNRMSGFLQWSGKFNVNDHQLWANAGIRAQNWTVNPKNNIVSKSQTVFSPRVQLAIKPNWDKDMLFRLSSGYYYQPPFYRELRGETGAVNPNVKAQRSIHFVVGNDYSFKLWKRPFKLVTEAYYKSLSDVNPFTVNNVQIRYQANNNTTAYATGFDMRLNGEFVEGTESYVTLGFLKTEENRDNKGYIARPTDQRLKFAVLFQDYIPKNPNFKMYLNMVYNTGVVGGSPSYADPYLFQNRLKDYFRSDIGISYVFVDSEKKPSAPWLQKFKELSAGIELFNMFDVQNSITNTWVRDIAARQFVAVPNYLSGRVLNFKLSAKF